MPTPPPDRVPVLLEARAVPDGSTWIAVVRADSQLTVFTESGFRDEPTARAAARIALQRIRRSYRGDETG